MMASASSSHSASAQDSEEFTKILNIVRSCVASIVHLSPETEKKSLEIIGKFAEPQNRHEKSVVVVVSHVKSEHERELALMCEKLAVTRETLYSTHRDVAKELFLAKVNWGRIVLLIAFAGSLSQYCLDHGIIETDGESKHFIEELTYWTAEFVHEELGDWIKENGGWKGFHRHFAYTLSYPFIKWGLICSAGLLGLAWVGKRLLSH